MAKKGILTPGGMVRNAPIRSVNIGARMDLLPKQEEEDNPFDLPVNNRTQAERQRRLEFARHASQVLARGSRAGQGASGDPLDPLWASVLLHMGFDVSADGNAGTWDDADEVTGATRNTTSPISGAGDLSIATTDDILFSDSFDMAAADWTFEASFKGTWPVSSSFVGDIFSKYATSGDQRGFSFMVRDGGGVAHMSVVLTSDGSTVTDPQTTHTKSLSGLVTDNVVGNLAWTRLSGEILYHFNGVYLGATTLSSSSLDVFNTSAETRVGKRNVGSGTALAGNIDRLRFTYGTARFGKANYNYDSLIVSSTGMFPTSAS